jgi:hypothetical protein
MQTAVLLFSIFIPSGNTQIRSVFDEQSALNGLRKLEFPEVKSVFCLPRFSNLILIFAMRIFGNPFSSHRPTQTKRMRSDKRREDIPGKAN